MVHGRRYVVDLSAVELGWKQSLAKMSLNVRIGPKADIAALC